MTVDETSLWLMVVGAFTAVIGIGLAYVMYTVASVQRALLRLQTDVTHMQRHRNEGDGDAGVSVPGDALLLKGGGGTTGQPRLESLAVAVPSSAPAALPLQELQQQQPSLQPAGVGTTTMLTEEWVDRLRQLENDVGALTQRLAQSSPMLHRDGGDGDGASTSSALDPIAAFSSPHKKPSALFQEIVAEMAHAAGQRSGAGSAPAPAGADPSTPSPRALLGRYASRQLPNHDESSISLRLAELSPLPNVSAEVSRVAGFPSPRSTTGPVARGGAPLEVPASSTTTTAMAAPATLAPHPYPLPVSLLLVGDAPPNTSKNPTDDVPALAACSHFVRSTVSLVCAANGDGAVLVIEPRESIPSSSGASGSGRRFLTAVSKIPLGNVACLHVALDTLPGVATECVVLVFIQNSIGSSQRTLRRLPPPTRSTSSLLQRRQSSVHVVLGGDQSVDGEDTTEGRVVLCADTHDADVSRFVDFLCSYLDGRVRHVTTATSDHALL